MHDPKFEQEVQQKMEELVFSPSEAVWAKVEQAVSKEKKRRVPLFWLFFLPGIFLLGAGGIYFANRTNSSSSVTINPSASDNLSTRNVPTAPKASLMTNASAEPTSTVSVPIAPGASSSVSASPVVSAKSGLSTVNNPGAASTRRRSGKGLIPSGNEGLSSFPTKPTYKTGQPDLQDGNNKEINEYVSAKPTKTGVQQESRTALKASTGKIVPLTTDGQTGVFPGFRTINKSASKTTVTFSALKQNNLAASPTQLSPKRSWEAGFTGGVGISTVNASFLTSKSIQAYDLPNANGLTAVTARAQKPFTSNVRPGPSFWAGIIMQKQISNRFTVAGGLSLHYYSTRIKTGVKVDDYQPSLNANVFSNSGYAAAPAPTTVYPYYAIGDEQVYTNRYYFLELPATLQYRLNHSKTMPLFWEGGVSFSYLMSSNALYYNQKSDVYNKDGQVANRAQVNVSSALLLGMPVGSSRLQVGPQIQYGITSLLNESSAASPGGRHLFYGGIKLVLLPAGKVKR